MKKASEGGNKENWFEEGRCLYLRKMAAIICEGTSCEVKLETCSRGSHQMKNGIDHRFFELCST